MLWVVRVACCGVHFFRFYPTEWKHNILIAQVRACANHGILPVVQYAHSFFGAIGNKVKAISSIEMVVCLRLQLWGFMVDVSNVTRGLCTRN